MFFLFNGVKIHYTDEGKGIPVVLLHGYLESSEAWNGFARKMATRFRIISVDLPGHGLSDSFGTIHTMEFIATVVKELTEDLNLNRIFLIGHSLGGYVTLAFLELFPDSLLGYSLFHSQPFPDTPETTDKRLREIALVREGKKEMFCSSDIEKMFAVSNLEVFLEDVRRLKKNALQTSDKGIIAILNGMMARPSRLSVMEAGRVPCLWILGEMDNYIPCAAIQARIELPSNARMVILSNSGHMGYIEEVDLAIKVVSDFVESLI
jgi:pimeloyl-ACP methyl ester carboxylesterase